jgi:hypothetical protein
MVAVLGPFGALPCYIHTYIVAGHGLEGRGSIPNICKSFLFSTESRPVVRPAQPPIQCVPGTLSWRYSGWGVKLIAHLHLGRRSRMVELYLHFPICIRGILLNYLTTGTAALIPFACPLLCVCTENISLHGLTALLLARTAMSLP